MRSTGEWCHESVNKGPFLGHCRDQAGVVTASADAQSPAQTLALRPQRGHSSNGSPPSLRLPSTCQTWLEVQITHLLPGNWTQFADLALFWQPRGAHWWCASPSPCMIEQNTCTMTIWHLLSIWQQLSILHRHPHSLPLRTPCRCLYSAFPSLPHSFSFLCGFFEPAYFHTPTTTELNSGFIKYAGGEKKCTSKSTDISSTILFMLYWELTSQSNESHSSVNIRRISFHPKKADQAQRLYGATGRCDAIALLVLSSWNQYEQRTVVRRRHLCDVETNLSDTDARCYALQSNIFLPGDGCNQLAHHLRSEANSSWQSTPSPEHRFYFSCCAAFWKKGGRLYNTRNFSFPGYRGNLV